MLELIKATTPVQRAIVGLIAVGLALGGVSLVWVSAKEEPSPGFTPRSARPPIDASAPVHTETATFALG